jgi:ABC-2 type transport system permease protein
MERQMINIFWETIKEKKWSLLIYCIAIILFIWMYVALFPSIKDSIGNMEQYLNSFPKAFMDAFGFDVKSFGTFEGYIGSEQFSFIWPIMLIALVVSLGSAFLAGEIEKGTIGILLSQPVSRVKIFFSKFMAGMTYLALFTAISVFSIFPLAKAYDISYQSERFYKLALVGFLLGLAIFGLSLLFSAIFSEKNKSTFIVVGILIVMYFINIISGLKDNLKNLKYLSFFYYFKPSDILSYNKIDQWTWWVFIGTFIISVTLALIWFSKRDIAV